MNKRLVLWFAFVILVGCFFAINVCAETPNMYIEFEARLSGNDKYVTVYTENKDMYSPILDLNAEFYLDADFTSAIDKADVTGIDFSDTVVYGARQQYVRRVTAANDINIYGNCAEVKWFSSELTSSPVRLFANWTWLTSFDFGCLTIINNDFLRNTGITELVIPETVTRIGNNAFHGCLSLTTVDLSLATSLTEIGAMAFSKCSALTTVISSGVNQEGAVIIPEGVVNIGQEAFSYCKSVKYLSLPSTITILGAATFRECSSLEFVDFNENANEINLYNWGHFAYCTSLRAVSLPNRIRVISNRFVNNCSSLEAVYLPSDLEQMDTNGYGQGPFCGSRKMYFVQEPFEVRDENGYFLGESFVMPQKPECYYMPENLSKAGGNVSNGTWFSDCISLNNVIVMPEAFTESTVLQMFRSVANSSQRKSVVYLGRITNYAWSEYNKYIDFVFAHPDNTGIDTLTFTSFRNRNNENSYFWFCSTGKKYTMAKSSAEEVAATMEENAYCHVVNPKASSVTGATCTTNMASLVFCFCGAEVGIVEEEGTALGHIHTVFTGYVYENYMAEGYAGYKCERCDDVNKDEKIDALFVSLGISAKTFGEDIGLVQGYLMNESAVEAYKENMGGAFDYGALACINVAGGEVSPKPGDDRVFDASFEDIKGYHIEIRVNGLLENDTVIFCLYVYDGEKIYYLDDGETKESLLGYTVSEFIN